MSAFNCWVFGCTYGEDSLCKRDKVKMYLVDGFPNTLVCESCYKHATGGELPGTPYFDWATDHSKDWDSSGLIWGLGWIEPTSYDELVVKLKKRKSA